jgi:hypothetical protein
MYATTGTTETNDTIHVINKELTLHHNMRLQYGKIS